MNSQTAIPESQDHNTLELDDSNLTETTSNKTEPKQTKCESCGVSSSWGMMSWCPECGFYPVVSQVMDVPVEEDEEEAVPKQGWQWYHTLNVGVVVIMLISIGAARFYYYFDGDRAIWTLAQTFMGVMLAACSHILTGIYAAKTTGNYNASSWILNPIDTWAPAVRDDQYKKNLTGLAWGVSAAVFACLVIGGVTSDHLFYKFNVDREPKVNFLQQAVGLAKGMAENNEDGDTDLEQAVLDFASGEETKSDSPDENQARCFVYGYMTNGGPSIKRVLLGSKFEGQMIHAGVLTAKQLGETRVNSWNTKLPRLQQSEPAVQTSFSATWVETTCTLSVEHDGRASDGTLKNIRVKEAEEAVSN